MSANKPSSVVVHLPSTAPEPPPELGVFGGKLWRDILAEWHIPDAPSLAVLEQASQAYDRAESLRRQILVAGELIETKGGGVKANPLIMAELQARAVVARLLGRLGVLDTDEPKRGPGRPPKLGGWYEPT